MRLLEIFDQSSLDVPTPGVQDLASKYGVSAEEILRRLKAGMDIEMEHTTDRSVAMEIAMDHLGERLDYYERLAAVDENDSRKVYPGQSSGRLKSYIKKKYGGRIGCKKAAMVINDPDVSNFYKKRAIWYKSLHCKGGKQIREDGPDNGAALTIFDIDDTLFRTSAKVMVTRPGKSPLRLSSSEFNSYSLKPGEEFDFSQFQDSKLFRDTSQPIEQLWKTLGNTLRNIGKRPGSKVEIVTARSDFDDKGPVLQKFADHGLDITKVHIRRAGNVGAGSSAENKKIVIRDLIMKGKYTEVRLFDDHHDNLAKFLELADEFPGVAFKAFPVVNGRVGSPITIQGDDNAAVNSPSRPA